MGQVLGYWKIRVTIVFLGMYPQFRPAPNPNLDIILQFFYLIIYTCMVSLEWFQISVAILMSNLLSNTRFMV